MHKLPGKRECGHAPLLRSFLGQSPQRWQSSALLTWLGQFLSPNLVLAPFGCCCLTGLLEGLGTLEGLEILEGLAVRDQISSLPTLEAQGPLPAGHRDGTARRAPAPAPGTQGASCCVTQRVLYACSFDKNKSSCLQFALNYSKVSAELMVPLRNDLRRCWQMALG